MHYLVTGHTGFKGSWLSLWLALDGHSVSGFSLDPEPGSLFERATVAEILTEDVRADIRDGSAVRDAVERIEPDVIVHMAAQPLVRESYRDPRWTIETNVMGTLNVLEATREASCVQAQLIVTTDKVYRNVNQIQGYVESDPFGGDDPYSASKAMADLLAHSWTTSFEGPPTAVARAGNVIGGGDVSEDRLLPDLLQAFSKDEAPTLRYPQAVRPWQHVLDCLMGYRTLIDHMLTSTEARRNWGAWNFGPGPENFVTVADIAARVAGLMGKDSKWENAGETLHEANLLALDASKAQDELGWADRLSLEEALDWTVQWFNVTGSGTSPRDVTVGQLEAYELLGTYSESS